MGETASHFVGVLKGDFRKSGEGDRERLGIRALGNDKSDLRTLLPFPLFPDPLPPSNGIALRLGMKGATREERKEAPPKALSFLPQEL